MQKRKTKHQDDESKGDVMSKGIIEQELTNPGVRLAFEQDWLHQEFVTQLEHHMEQSKMNRKMLAQKMGRTPAFITKAMRQGHNLTANTMVEMALAAGYRINLILDPFIADELPKSALANVESIAQWQANSIVSWRAANDNARQRKTWEDDEVDGTELAAAA